MTRDERLAEIVDLNIPFADYVGNAYQVLSDSDTLKLFGSFYKLYEIMGAQGALEVSSKLSSLSPQEVLPWSYVLWEPVVPDGSGNATLEDPPWDILGVKTTISTTDDWVNASYDRATGVISGMPALPAGVDQYWIPQLSYTNPYMWSYTAAMVGLEEKESPEGYSPVHVPPLLQCMEWALQMGPTQEVVSYVSSALAGNPFAYIEGTITSQDATSITITPASGDPVVCELPTGYSGTPLANSTSVKKYQPLSSEVVTITTEGNSDTQWEAPIEITSISSSNNQVVCESAPAAESYDWVKLSILESGYSKEFLVIARQGSTLVLDGTLPVAGTWNYLQVMSSPSEAVRKVSLAVPLLSGNTNTHIVEPFMKRVFSPHVKVDVKVS